MSNSKNSLSSHLSTIVVTAIATCGVTLGAATLLSSAAATPGAPVFSADAADSGYLPAQIVNQAGEIELLPDIYY
jgi:hypothetical protein